MAPKKRADADRRSRPIKFNDAAVEQIRAALAPHAKANGLDKLPLVLREWGKRVLPEHLSRVVPNVQIAKRQMLSGAAEHAQKLASALTLLEKPQGTYDVGPSPAFSVAIQMAATASGKSFIDVDQTNIDAELAWLKTERERLTRLAQAAEAVAIRSAPKKGQPRAKPQYLTMLDLAAIFEWATQKRAERRVRNLDHPDSGDDYGPFWDFASSVWPTVFGTTKGLPSAMKNWAAFREKYDEASPVVANINMRHPEWGLIAAS